VRELYVGSLNSDEQQDVVVYGLNGIASLTNKGMLEGTWLGFDLMPVDSPVNSWDAQAGTINDDEFLDLVVGDQEQIKIYLSNGEGGFEVSELEVSAELIAETTHRRLDVGDLDNDGLDDIVTGYTSVQGATLSGAEIAGPVATYLNRGSVSFEETVISEWGAHNSLALVDVSRDGNLDIMLGGGGDSAVYSGHGDGTVNVVDRWGSLRTRGTFRKENSDGGRAYSRPRQEDDSYIQGGLFLELDGSEFAIDLAPWRTGAIPHFADMDGDGADEVIGLSGSRLTVVNLHEDPSSLVSPDAIYLTASDLSGRGYSEVPRFLGDFDGNGYADQAWVADRGESITIQVRWGDPTPPGDGDVSVYEFPLKDELEFYDHAESADFNQDGFTDLQFGTFSESNIVLLGSADRTFRLEYTEKRFRATTSKLSAQGDIDGDGLDDLVTLTDSWLNGIVIVRRGIEGGVFEEIGVSYHFLKSAWDYQNIEAEFVHLADMTGDGILDVVTFDEANTGSFVIFPGVSNLASGDVNGDGEATLDDLELLASLTGSDSESQGRTDLKLDWTGDQRADERDVVHLVEQVFQTREGDTNLDGRVDFEDFLVVSNSFGSEGSWRRDGDFDGNGKMSLPTSYCFRPTMALPLVSKSPKRSPHPQATHHDCED